MSARRGPQCPTCGGSRLQVTDRDWQEQGFPLRCLDCPRLIRADAVKDDGRVDSPDGARARIAEARARRDADPRLASHALWRELHEIYCETAEAEGWVEIMAADVWAERELAERLAPRLVHRTQVRRARRHLEELGYVRRLEKPTRRQLQEKAGEYRARGRKPPLFIEVLKATKEDAA